MKTFSKEEIKDIVESYQKGISKRQLKTKYNVSDSVINRILKENNILIRGIKEANSKRKYNINDNYFDIESPNMAYILGFWAADGNVHSTENRLDLELASKDYEILEKIQKELNNERPIKIYNCNNGYTKNKIYFWSSKIKKIFIEYGIVPNKTYSENFHAPYKLDKKYWIDYIRGFFDGDGCVKKSSSLTFELNSLNKKFLEDIQKFFKEYYNMSLQISTVGICPNKEKMYRLYCYGEQARAIFKILYTPNSLFLKRKYQRWLELL